MPPPTVPTLHRWSDIPPEQLNPLLTRQYVAGDLSMLARLVLAKGCIVPMHSHPNEQISYILSGRLRFHLNDTAIDVAEILVIPANLPHSAEALEDTIDLDLFAPPRQDWLTHTDAYLR